MPPLSDDSLLPDDPALAGGEWLFRRGGEVFGPIDSRALAAMLYRGELDAGTPVSTGDGRWQLVSEVAVFRVHARKAEAALRVEREVTGARLLRRRRSRRKAVLLALGGASLVAGAAAAAVLLAPGRGGTSPLLEDFGQGLRIASARVSVERKPQAGAPGDVEVALDKSGAPAPSRRAERPSGRPAASRATPAGQPVPRGAGADDALVATHFDAGKIQATVNQRQRSLVRCFREEAGRTPGFQGDVPLEFAVGNDGKVVALWIDEPRFKQGALHDCIQGELAAWRFDPFPGQRPTVQLGFRVGQ
jgi:hypothetical protein